MPTLGELASMRRAQLQALSKENHLKANGKTELLVQQLAQHYGLSPQDAPAPAPAPKKVAAKARRPTGTVSKVAPAPAAEPTDVNELDEDDEMRMGGTPVVANKSKAVFAGLCGFKKVGPARVSNATASSSSSGHAGPPSLSGHVGPEPAHGTSPATKAAIKDIQATLSSIRTELSSIHADVATVHSSLAATDKRAASNLDAVHRRIDSEIAKVREQQASGIAGQDEVIGQLEGLRRELKSEVAKGNGERTTLRGKMDSIQLQVDKLESHSTTLAAFRDVSTRLATVEKAIVAPAGPSQQQQPQASTSTATKSEFAPAAALATHVADSSPTSRPISRRNSPAPSSRASPRKQPATSALPTHMLTAAAFRLASPTRSRASSLAPSPAPAMPISPVQRARQSLGKHARYSDSDTSDISIVVAAVVSPPPASTPGRVFAGAPRSAGNECSGGHARKRIRVSEYDGAEDQTVDGEVEAEQEQELAGAGDETSDDSRFFADADDGDLSVGDDSYFVSTKGGDDSVASIDPFSLPSISDPGYFGNSAATTSAAPIFTATHASRKSLPLSTLPFPLISPYAKTAPTSRPSLAEFGNRTSSGGGAGSVPPTPQASKTLYGTERTIGDAEAGSDDDLDVSGMGSRFEDDDVTTFGLGVGAAATPAKKWGAGLWTG